MFVPIEIGWYAEPISAYACRHCQNIVTDLDSRIEEQFDYLSCSITRLSHNERKLLVRYRMMKKEGYQRDKRHKYSLSSVAARRSTKFVSTTITHPRAWRALDSRSLYLIVAPTLERCVRRSVVL